MTDLGQSGSVFDDVLIGGQEYVEPRLADLLSQQTSPSGSSL